jgi:DNA-binding beta-propeller fold protein YncE
VAIGHNGYIYVTDTSNDRVQYFTSTGSFLGKWGREGYGNGEFGTPVGVAVARDGTVFVADVGRCRLQYFTPAGSFLGKFGKYGTGPGEFNCVNGIALTRSGRRLYVADMDNHRLQYFRDAEYAVEPASLGRVKALFR